MSKPDPDQTIPRDPFAEARAKDGVMHLTADGCPFPVLLRHADVRAALKDWKTFSNDDPFHITPTPETGVRDVRQLPIETDPPEHTAYRKLVDPFFRRPLDPRYRADMQTMIDDHVRRAVEAGEVEVVHELALPVQSIALCRLLNVPDEEAKIYVGWGLHVFYDNPTDGENPGGGQETFDGYVRRKLDEATDPAGEDFFSHLNHATLDGRPLTDEEKRGYLSVTFAGGRDTVIRSITAVFAHLADPERGPAALEWLRAADDAALSTAVEEYLRHASPLTTLARRCPHGTDLAGLAVPPGGRVGVNYAAANYDPAVFDAPDQLQLDRKPNPHVAFGFGKHHCLGAHQARLILTCLLKSLAYFAKRLHTTLSEISVEKDTHYVRKTGFFSLRINSQ